MGCKAYVICPESTVHSLGTVFVEIELFREGDEEEKTIDASKTKGLRPNLHVGFWALKLGFVCCSSPISTSSVSSPCWLLSCLWDTAPSPLALLDTKESSLVLSTMWMASPQPRAFLDVSYFILAPDFLHSRIFKAYIVLFCSARASQHHRANSHMLQFYILRDGKENKHTHTPL